MEIVEHGHQVEVHEADHGHLSAAEQNYLLKTGWWVYIASEIMLFSSFIAVMFLAHRLYPDMQAMLDVPLTTVNTFLLLTSSWTLAVAVASLQQGNITALQRNLFITMALGTVFLGIQAYEYSHLSHEGFVLGYNMYTDIFYILTGFHGLHVAIGVVWLLRCWLKSLRGDYTRENYIGIEVLGLYWHFVDIVWIVLFPLIYLF